MNELLINSIKQNFETEFNTEPVMIFSPGRINLIGEHVDYNDGLVFPAAIDKGIVVALQKAKAEDQCTVISADFKESFSFGLKNLAPLPEGGWRNYVIGVVAELLKKGCELHPFNICFGGDVPSGAGLSSSAALENGIVFGLNQLFDLQLSKTEMIFISQKAEHDYVGVKCGIMDQFASMFGKEDHFLLLDCRSMDSSSYSASLSDYEILLVNSNVKHNLADSTYNKRRALCEKAAEMMNVKALRDARLEDLSAIKEQLSEEDYQMVSYVIEEIQRVEKAAHALDNNDILKLGTLLYESHQGLSQQYQVSCAELDFLVSQARESGMVIGARMMGGGFGGCTINLVKKEFADQFFTQLQKAYREEFGYECTLIKVQLSNGTKLINTQA